MKSEQLKSGIILSYATQAVSMAAGLIYTPFMIRLLGQSEYGVYILSASVIAYLKLLNLGFGSSYFRYYAIHKKEGEQSVERLNGTFMSVFLIIALIALMAGIVIIAGTPVIFSKSLTPAEIKTARVLMAFLVFNMVLSFPGSVFKSYIIANEKFFFIKLISLLDEILRPCLTLPLLFLGYKSVAVVVIISLLSVFDFVASVVFCKKRLSIKFRFDKINSGFFGELFAFSFFIFLNMIIDQINWNVDKFLIGIYKGAATVAIYGIASQLNLYYMNFSTTVSSVFAPKVNKLVADGNCRGELTELFTKVGRIQFVVVSLVLSGYIVFGKNFIQIWAGKGYEDSYYTGLYLMVPTLVPLIQNLGIEIQRAKNMHKFRSIVLMVISFFNIGISIPLVKIYGAQGAAAGTGIAMIIGNIIIMNIYYHKKIELDMIYFWKKILSFIPALIAPAVLGTLILLFAGNMTAIAFIACAIGYTAVFALSMWFFGLNDDEKKIVSSFGKTS